MYKNVKKINTFLKTKNYLVKENNENTESDNNGLIGMDEKTRSLFILGDITQEVAFDFHIYYISLASSSSDPIFLFINSPGGSLFAMAHILNIINAFNSKLYTIGSGNVASAAYYIFLHGYKRYAFPLTHFLSHSLRFIGYTDNSLKNLKSLYEQYEQIWENKLEQKEQEIIKKKFPEFKQTFKQKESIFDIDTAKKYGIVTNIIKKMDEIC